MFSTRRTHLWLNGVEVNLTWKTIREKRCNFQCVKTLRSYLHSALVTLYVTVLLFLVFAIGLLFSIAIPVATFIIRPMQSLEHDRSCPYGIDWTLTFSFQLYVLVSQQPLILAKIQGGPIKLCHYQVIKKILLNRI